MSTQPNKFAGVASRRAPMGSVSSRRGPRCKTAAVSRGIAIAFGSTLTLTAVSSFAQQANPQPSQQLERVEITGSRIRSLNAESPSPVQVITADEIASTGAVTVQDLLLKNPTAGTPTISRTNSNFQTSSVGVSTIDLRNLGESRTLVLVNGRRFVAGIPGESAVDLNTIPADFVERIELLTGGASSTYGSDAVAGVVNIILKKNFEGFLVDASAGQSEKGDDSKRKISLTFGTTAASGKASFMGHLGYSRQGAVYSRDRDFAAVDQSSLGALTGDVNDFFTIQRPFYSSYAPQGRFFTDTGSFTYDAQGNVIPFSTNGPNGDGVGATGFNRSAYRSIAVPTERYLFAATGEYALAENHKVFFEGNYAQTQTKAKLEPFPLGAEAIYPATGGQVPAEFLVNGVVLRNPLVPDALYDNISDTNGDGLRDYYFTRRLSDIGARGSVADRDTFRVATGLKGTLASKWDYDAYVIYGSTKEAQTNSGQVNVLNFRNALEAIPDVNDVNGNGSTTDAICRDANARDQGCVPINLFGFNSISPAAAAYVAAPGLLTTFTQQKIAGANITGELFNLPAGPVGVAGGVEYRKEYARSEFDPLQQAGLNAGNAIPRTEGDFDVKEIFVEGRVPLLKNQPFAKSLDVSAAVRGSKYSTVGNTLSYNTGLDWAPTSEFRVRATKALSTRAPNINELFSPPSQNFPTGLNDPCLGVTATSTGASDAACRADPGVAANIAANGAFTLNQADVQGISGYDRGNPLLKQEKGNSVTLGLVFTPRSMPLLKNFVFTADYFNIKIKGAIVGTPRQFILSECYAGDASFCQFVTRRPAAVGANSAGSISYLDSAQTNSGELVTSGIDLTAGFSEPVGPGRLNAQLAYTHLTNGYLVPLPGAEKDYFAGEIGAPRNRAYLTLNYKTGPWGITSHTTFLGQSALDDQFLASYGADANSVKVKSKIYNDFQFSYQAGRFQYYLGVDNAFNTRPAPVLSNLPGNDTGTETHAGLYDPIGRRYYIGIRFGL